MALRIAQRSKSKLRLGVSGPAGAGKTLGSLLVAYGICPDWSKICVIDTENNSADLYADYNQNGIQIGQFMVNPIQAPYSPEKYTNAIKECEAAGMEVIIIDSLTHAWQGEGGLLDKKGQIEKKAGYNSWTAWREVTPEHNRLVEAILQSKCHMLCTIRAKMDYVQEKDPDTGKTVIKKVGLQPVQRDGMEYEFTVFIDVDQNHQATSSKDRTSIIDGRVFMMNVELGKQFLNWLETGEDPSLIQPITSEQINEIYELSGKNAAICKEVLSGFGYSNSKEVLQKDFKAICKKVKSQAKKAQKQAGDSNVEQETA